MIKSIKNKKIIVYNKKTIMHNRKISMHNKKTVIQVWGHDFVNNKDNDFWGIGDCIRGTMHLFQLSKKLNFNLEVNMQLHPISHFLKQQKSIYNSFIIKNKSNIPVQNGNPEEYIINNKNNVIYLFSNHYFRGEITNECKKFIKNVMTPNKTLKKYLAKQYALIPYKGYNILHYRMGDDELVLNKELNNIKNIALNIEKQKEDNDIFISDSISLKKYIKKNTNIFMFDTIPMHLGHTEKIFTTKDTLLDFFLIAKAKKIKTYSVYQTKNGTSGFVYWAHKIWDIPLTVM